MASAIAKQAIFAGAAVAQSGDVGLLAGGSVLATHIAITGTPIGGVVSLISNGRLDLIDWTLPTGSKYLKTGATYTVGANGVLVANGTGQPIGIATSLVTLSVTIQTATSSTVTITTPAAPVAPTLTVNQFLSFLAQVRFAGSSPIANGVNNGTVIGLALSFTPTRAILSVRKPANGLNLFATVVDGSLSSSGFPYYLNGLTDSTGYTLDYELSA